ncbi:MAG: glycoside hydrolase family 3 N-terminal domain-containing protein [Acidimicrobiia bacterium]
MEPHYRDPQRPVAERVDDLLGRMTLEEKVAQLGAVWVSELVVDGSFDPDVALVRIEHGIGQVTRIGASTGLRSDESATLMNEIQRVVIERTRLGIPVLVHEEAVGGFCHRGATTFPQAIGLAATWDPDLIAEIGAVIRAQMMAVGARQNLAPVLDVARDPRWGRVEETYGESAYLCGRMGAAYVGAIQTDDLADGVVCTGKHFLGYAASTGGRNQAPVHLGPRELREVYAEPFAACIRDSGLASVMNSYSSIDGVPCAGSHEILTDLLRDELGFDGPVVADYFAVVQLARNHFTAADKAEAASQALRAGLDVELPSLDCYRELPALVRDGRLDEGVVDTAVRRVLVQKFQLGLFDEPYVEPAAASSVFDGPENRSLARRAGASSFCLLANDGILPLDPARLVNVAVIGPHGDDRRLLQGDYHYPAHLEILFDNPFVQRDDEGAAANEDQLPGDGGSFAPGAWFTPHVTPLDGLRVALGPAVEVVGVRGCSDHDSDDTDIDAAVAAAIHADVAIVCIGARSGLTIRDTVGEARDVVSLDFPGAQRALADAVVATGTPTVVVVISGRVHTLDGLPDRAAATLYAWLPGEETGNALADVLLGGEEPGGRLPISLPRHVGQIPLHHDMRSRGDRSEFYGDYVDAARSPLFPFGHGLGYTTFEYSELAVTAGTTSMPTKVGVTVRNTGNRGGSEVVQLYARDEVASVARPILELVGFARLRLEPGASQTVEFAVHPSRLAFHDAEMQLVCEPGAVTFSVGASSTRLRARQTVELRGETTGFRRTEIVDTVVTIG